MIKIINNKNELEILKPDLEEVYRNHKGFSFFSPTYILESINKSEYKKDITSLYFVLIKPKNKILSYIPFYIDSKKTLRFIFDKHTDFCGVIGQKPDLYIFKDLSKKILNESRIHNVSLDNMLPGDSLLNNLKHFLGDGVAITCYNNHSFIHINDKGFLGHLKSKEKSELKRVRNKNESLTFEVLNGNKAFPAKEIKAIRNQMIANKIRNNNFFGDSFLSFSKSLYDAGELEIFTKWNGDTLVSSSLVLKNSYSNVRLVWIDLYADIQYINLSSYIDYVYYLKSYSPLILNFGRGSYDYKTKNFQPEVKNLYNLRYSKSKYKFLFTNYYLVRYFLKRVIKE